MPHKPSSPAAPSPEAPAAFAGLSVPLDTAPMEAKLVDALPDEPGWRFEPKWDGFRCLAFKAGGTVDLRAKSGKPLTRYFPDMAAVIAAMPQDRLVIDGELVIPVEGAFSFDALQLRLHPAESRVRKLASETPAVLIAFDCLMDPAGASLLDQPLSARRTALEAICARATDLPAVQLTPYTDQLQQARGWLSEAGSGALDGVVCKRADDIYHPGERSMLKVKRQRTADCVVGGFRYATDSDKVGSLLLGLFDAEGRLNHVGFTSAIPAAERPALTRQLEALTPGPGFTGRSPGGPSRWSTDKTGAYVALRHELVVEVGFDHVTGDRMRHGSRLVRFRPDKAPAQCTMDQIEPPKALKQLGL
jgi:ATP-dependent DNA ligase